MVRVLAAAEALSGEQRVGKQRPGERLDQRASARAIRRAAARAFFKSALHSGIAISAMEGPTESAIPATATVLATLTSEICESANRPLPAAAAWLQRERRGRSSRVSASGALEAPHAAAVASRRCCARLLRSPRANPWRVAGAACAARRVTAARCLTATGRRVRSVGPPPRGAPGRCDPPAPRAPRPGSGPRRGPGSPGRPRAPRAPRGPAGSSERSMAGGRSAGRVSRRRMRLRMSASGACAGVRTACAPCGTQLRRGSH